MQGEVVWEYQWVLECEDEWSGGESVRERGEGVPASVIEGRACTTCTQTNVQNWHTNLQVHGVHKKTQRT